MYIPLSDDKHQFVRVSSKKRTGNLRQNSVHDKLNHRQKSAQEKIQEFIFPTKFFSNKNYFSNEFFSNSQILSWTEFVLD